MSQLILTVGARKLCLCKSGFSVEIVKLSAVVLGETLKFQRTLQKIAPSFNKIFGTSKSKLLFFLTKI